MTSCLFPIYEALRKNTPFNITLHEHPNSYCLHPLSAFQRIYSYINSSYSNTRLLAIAALIQRDLSHNPRRSPIQMQGEEALKAARLLIAAAGTLAKDAPFQPFMREVVAASLAIPTEALNEEINPGLHAFAKNNHLHNLLITQNHSLHVDPKTHKIFIKHKDVYVSWEEAENILTGFLAANLNIPVKAIHATPGFQTLAFTKTIYNYLMTYKETILVDPESQQIQIRINDTLYEPATAFKIIQKMKGVEVKTYKPLLYGPKGLQNDDRYQWPKCRAKIKGDVSTWAPYYIHKSIPFDSKGKCYVMEYASSATKPQPRAAGGDHTWVRLYKFDKDSTNERITGKMYSYGLYRPEKKPDLYGQLWLPAKIKEGFLTNEVSEDWGISEETITIRKQIAKDSFDQMLGRIQEFHFSDKPQKFQILKKNCDELVSRLGAMDGHHLPTDVHFFELLTVSSIQERLNASIEKLPRPLQVVAHSAKVALKVFLVLLTPFFALVCVCLGATVVDKSLKKRDPSAKPYYNSLWDIFDPQKLRINSPWILAWVVKKNIEKWRRVEIEKLNAEAVDYKEQKMKIKYDFPPEYKFSTQALCTKA